MEGALLGLFMMAACVLATALGRVLETVEPEAVLLPLGLFHSDHRLASDATLALQRANGATRWFAYADAVYRAFEGDPVGQRLAELAASGVRAQEVPTPRRPAPATKRHAVACYQSQLRALEAPGHPGWADALAPERFWRLRS